MTFKITTTEVVDADGQGRYAATCHAFGLVELDKTELEAIQALCEVIAAHIASAIENKNLEHVWADQKSALRP